VEEYLKLQGRFEHLFRGEDGEVERSFLQEVANENARRLDLAVYQAKG
jgi:hypothetical protein